MRQATADPDNDFVEGLFYSSREFYLTVGRMVDDTPWLDTIYGQDSYYRRTRHRAVMYLPTEEYIFRFDPDWFWNVPEGGFYTLFRRFAPKSLRNADFYSRYTLRKNKLFSRVRLIQEEPEEPLIQDWQVTWDKAAELTCYALEHVDLQDKPWAAVPINSPNSPTLYPIRAGTLYYNLGCYCHVKKSKFDDDFYYTKILDRKCVELGGIKMLYSSSFFSRNEFDRIYNGSGYNRLKKKYDPDTYAPTLFEKAVLTH